MIKDHPYQKYEPICLDGFRETTLLSHLRNHGHNACCPTPIATLPDSICVQMWEIFGSHSGRRVFCAGLGPSTP
jgi:hypothetical protein